MGTRTYGCARRDSKDVARRRAAVAAHLSRSDICDRRVVRRLANHVPVPVDILTNVQLNARRAKRATYGKHIVPIDGTEKPSGENDCKELHGAKRLMAGRVARLPVQARGSQLYKTQTSQDL